LKFVRYILTCTPFYSFVFRFPLSNTVPRITMPKRKNSDIEDLKYLKKRLKSLEEKLKNKSARRRIRVIEDSSSSSEASRDPSPTPEDPQGTFFTYM
jgi:hypothetical protein